MCVVTPENILVRLPDKKRSQILTSKNKQMVTIMIEGTEVDSVISHIERRVLAKIEILMENAKDSNEQAIIASVTQEILATIRHT